MRRTPRRPRRTILGLTGLATLLAGLAPLAPARADHRDAPPATVTVVGSLQSELGCAADWTPDCAQSSLVRQDDGSWALIAEVPAGSYELKVTVNGSWDENYGAGGTAGGANIPLVLQQPARLRFAYDDTTHRVAVAPADQPSPRPTAADRRLATTSLRGPLTRENFYFVMADRFANGDPANDAGGLAGDRMTTGLDPTHKGFFHGGDIRGLSDRLDYIAGLGTTAIWLTPSFQNRPVQGTGDQASAGYHGYWVTDFTRIDPHFGTNAELKAFIDKAHGRGIKVFFDIITNHTADVIDYAEVQPGEPHTYISKEAEPFRDASGQPFDDRRYAGGETFPQLDAAASFPYTPVFRSEADRTVKVPAWLNDPTMYHNRGDSTFAGESSTYGDFSGLDDLFTERPDVVDKMTDIYRTWVDFGIDGFRIDTVKHVNLEFWQEFAPAIRDHATSIGNRDFFAFGEVYDANPAYLSTFSTAGRLDATLDFGFQEAGTGFAKGGATTRLRDFFAGDDWYTDADSNAYASPTFLGNHDMGRIGTFLRGTDSVLERDRLAHTLMYLTRGQPVVYYGDEQGFVGDGGDQDAREDMFASRVATYNDNDLIGTDATTAGANYDTGHPLYRTIRDLARLRRTYPALADGAQLHRYASNSAGVYAFSRIDAGERREFLVALNNATTARTVTVATEVPRGGFTRVWPAGRAVLRTDEEARTTITVPPLSAVVWRADRRIPGQGTAPAIHLEKPSAGGTVGGRSPITVGVPDGGFNQVTVAWRPAGATQWTALGTDDNAPYRVFHDVSAMPKGTLLEYRAALRDSSGNLSVASSYATVGDPEAEPTPGGGGGGGPVTQPGAVSMPGSHNSEIGCPGDWQPDCAEAQMSLDADDLVWKKTVALPAGGYEYKAALENSWDENYGAGGARGGGNIALTLGAARDVTFYYDHASHWITTDANGPIATLAGSFQSELGCPADWSPDCMRSWLKDLDGDGTYTFAATLPPGSYETKVAHGLSWAENYGQDGAPDGANIPFSVPAGGVEVLFTYDVTTHRLQIATRAAGASPDLTKAKAQWLRRDLVAWDVPDPESRRYRLHWSTAGDLAVDAEAVTGGSSLPLAYDPEGLPDDVLADFPHLEGYEAFRLDRRAARRVPEVLTGQLAVASYDRSGALHDATGVQVPGVLDDVYADAARADLGATWHGGRPSLAVWAPTAQRVAARVAGRQVPMTRHRDGTWRVSGPAAWRGAAYTYDVTVWSPSAGAVVTNRVTDPYSVALTANSRASLLVDLDDPALAPAGWSRTRPPTIAQPEDRTVYELHVRDFSIGDETVPAAERGTYLAFTRPEAAGMRHLRRLAAAGLNTVHLLPAFDIATIEERRSAQQVPACDLAALPPDSTEQQACVEAVRTRDGFNWGYDPLHYTTPEGSYATDPEGTRRTVEFRRMVQGLNAAGLQVVMDVVYNHTAASGQDEKSVLDKVVPGYYHRLSAAGAVETSTCCSNTASEHRMMEKLMIDSVLTWAREYKVNGFRFDLMGHHSLENMTRLRAALDRLTVARDGVDGKGVYLYGEGWNFGEVADDARFVQATQRNLAGTGIGSFSDRLRDAVRGGGPFDEDPRVQGFGSGLFTDPNGAAVNGTAEEQLADLMHAQDLVKLGLAGNLADFSFRDSSGAEVVGSEVDYNGQPAGYAADPSETVTYVDAHDNETLFDSLAFKLPQGTTMADRVRMSTVSLSTVALSQGVVFWHAGTDLLRSKSLDRNSYDSGDWFNRVDWQRRENTFGSGLPLRADNEAKWPYMRPLLADPALDPGPEAMDAAHARAQDLLRIRMSSRLFRLGSLDDIQDKVSFLDAEPGVVAMLIDDTVGDDADPGRDGILVVFNASPDAQTVGGTGAGWRLHDVQASGTDAVVKGSTVAADAVTVPGRTTAVFER
ncbi:pullulanase-type alpha-1,6-glucosidase [Microbacterium sp. ARD31]|uniref:pullulanase-type alpha-1,6-glucosidase n=1 Tax=Microbacterium sp. ARD31 TaxID=2962576 RepID=UPI0028818CE5|nr:pullulanase-type alpha-1,6-glucosidase [Microbacterium sp. ARD31]MDT0185585.1 pullulanase-type alpha-1,6-glucosidase [Microbacterium sp. ARD31]